jgi:spermidine synthase
MGGLALGSYVFGRLADRMRGHVAVYGVLEAVIGGYGLLVPAIFACAVPLYKAVWDVAHLSFYPFSILRFLLAVLVLILPTTLMGATLPVLSKFIVRSRRTIGSGVGKLYAVNTLGAMAGTFLAGFVFIPALGERGTTLLASSVCFFVAVLAVAAYAFLFRSVRDAAGEEPDRPGAAEEAASPWSEEGRKGLWLVVLGTVALSGFAAITYQVAWTRLLSLIIGSSVYAYAVILTTFLAGLALGSSVMGRFVGRLRRPVTVLALLQLAIATSVLCSAFFYNYIFYIFVRMFSTDSVFYQGLTNFTLAAVVIFVPTFLMGAVFPVVVSIHSREIRRLGRRVGEVYTVNTVGAIAGSFVAGFVLIPLLGIQSTVVFAIGVNLLPVAVLTLALRRSRGPARWVVLGLGAAAAFLAFFVLPPPSAHVFSTGVFKNSRIYDGCSTYREFRTLTSDYMRRVLYHREGITTTVTVSKFPSQHSVAVNGKIDGSSVGDMHTQSLSGHIPLLFADRPRRVLVVGYGTGVTLGVVTLHPGVKAWCVELEPAVIQAGWHFAHVNYNTEELVRQGKVEIIENDGRNYLLAGSETYDAVISEPSNPWISGSAKLFTREFFEIVRQRLNPGGVYGQWVQLYGMDTRNVQSLLKTFVSVFGSALVFYPTYKCDILLIAKKDGDLRVPLSRVDRLFETPAVRDDLWLLGIRDRAGFLLTFLLDSEGLDGFLKDSPVPLNTDDNSFIEFNAPRTLHARGTGAELSRRLIEHMPSPLDTFLPDDGKPDWGLLRDVGLRALEMERRPYADRLLAVLESEIRDAGGSREETPAWCLLRAALAVEDKEWDEAEKRLKKALEANPADTDAARRLGRVYRRQGMWLEARDAYRRVLDRRPEDRRSLFWTGDILARTGNHEEALGFLGPLSQNPAPEEIEKGIFYTSGLCLAALGRTAEATAALERQVLATPDHTRARKKLRETAPEENLAPAVRELLALRSNAAKAQELYKAALKVARTEERFDDAVDVLLESIEQDAFGATRYQDVCRLLLTHDRYEKAFAVYRQAVRIFPQDLKLRQVFAYHLETFGDRRGPEEGRRYLEEAVAVLRRTLRLCRDPLVLNEIHYRIELLEEQLR